MKYQFKSDLHKEAFIGCVSYTAGNLATSAAEKLLDDGADFRYMLKEWPGYLEKIAEVAVRFDPVFGTAPLANEIEEFTR